MNEFFDVNELTESLKDSVNDLLIARREETCEKLLEVNNTYSLSKITIENYIDKLRETDAKTADKLERSFEYIEESLVRTLYNKGFSDGQEVHTLLSNSIFQVNG